MPDVAPTSTGLAVSWRDCLLIGWGLGSLGWLVTVARSCYLFRSLLTGTAIPAPEESQRIAQLAQHLGLDRVPLLRLLPARISPATWALGMRAVVLVPEELWRRLSVEQRDALLVHELAHLRRGDQWVRRLELILLFLYWWHPIYWLARRQLHEAEEQCCDAWVTWLLPNAAGAYADLLIDTVAYVGARPCLPPLSSGLGYVRDLRHRLRLILRGQTPRRLSLLGWLLLLAAGSIALPLLPTLVSKAGEAETASHADEAAVPEEAPKELSPAASRPTESTGATPSAAVTPGERLDRMERRLDQLLREAQELMAEIRAERAKQDSH